MNKDSVFSEIENWNYELSEENKNLKYKKMLESEYIFFRGTNHLFWENLANDKRLQYFGNEKLKTWLQGDLHAYNYGIYDNDNGEIVYDLNDFDESFIADYQYDIWRMATSIKIIAAENDEFTFSDSQEFISEFSKFYIETINKINIDHDEQKFYATKENSYGKLDNVLKKVEEENSRKKMLKKWTNKKNEFRVFDLENEKLSKISTKKYIEIEKAIENYGKTLVGKVEYTPEYFKVIDIAERISSGTGSFGRPRYYVLLNASGCPNNYKILDVKLQTKPSAYHFLNLKQQEIYDAKFHNEGRRHAMAYIALSQNTDDFLGWLNLEEGIFSVRERSPYKEYLDTKDLKDVDSFLKITQQWGKILATTHCRAYAGFYKKLFIDSVKNRVTEFVDIVNQVATEAYLKNAEDYAIFKNQLSLEQILN